MVFFKLRVANVLLFCECLVMFCFYIFSGNGWFAYRKLCLEKDALSCQLNTIKQEIEGLQTEMSNYAQDDFYKEKIAREQLHMARPEDIVIYLPKGNS